MRISEAAKRIGVSPDWLRQLERDHRIPSAQRDVNGYRRYSAADVEALRRVLFALPRGVRSDMVTIMREAVPQPIEARAGRTRDG